jgi:DnaD/phage-associated family protein
MPRTKLIKQKNTDFFLSETNVTNLFISELLPSAPGDYVKLYLYGLMYASRDENIERRTVSRVLGMREEDIENAWNYWAERGVIKKYVEDGIEVIEFVDLIELVYGSKSEEARAQSGAGSGVPEAERETADSAGGGQSASAFISKELKILFDEFETTVGRPISGKEMGKMRDALEVYEIPADIFAYAIKYCDSLGKHTIEYIFTVANRWKEAGCTNVAEVREKLERDGLRNSYYQKVFRELGFNRMITPGDREIMSAWFDELGCSIDEVLEVCRRTAGMRSPNLRTVNTMLRNERMKRGGIDPEKTDASAEEKGPVSRRVLEEYYQYLREKAEADLEKRSAEASRTIPRMGEILAGEKTLLQSMVAAGFGSEGKERRAGARKKLELLEEEKQTLLKENGFPADYLERQYKCNICKDTGTTNDGQYCTCAKDRAEEAYRWNQMRTRNN